MLCILSHHSIQQKYPFTVLYSNLTTPVKLLRTGHPDVIWSWPLLFVVLKVLLSKKFVKVRATVLEHHRTNQQHRHSIGTSTQTQHQKAQNRIKVKLKKILVFTFWQLELPIPELEKVCAALWNAVASSLKAHCVRSSPTRKIKP